MPGDQDFFAGFSRVGGADGLKGTASSGFIPSRSTAWKKQAVETMPEGFGTRRERTAAEQAELERRLYEKIGRLETELDWLKKKWGLSLEQRRELIQPHRELSLRRQCELLNLHRTGLHPV